MAPIAPLASPLPPAAPGSAVSVRRLRVALGTWLAIDATAESEERAIAAIGVAVAAVSEVESRMHPERTGSDVQRISQARPGEDTPIDVSTWQVLRLAQRLHELTDGIFDPCLPVKPGRLSDLELHRTPPECAPVPPGAAPVCSVICRAPVALDLGGIAKGFAVDRAVEALSGAGCSAGLVNAGGDLRLFGAQREPLLLRHPHGRYQPLWLENAALAVSDRDAHTRPAQHRGYYVRAARPAGEQRFAAVIAAAAMNADALTKCVLLCPRASARRALEECGGHLP